MSNYYPILNVIVEEIAGHLCNPYFSLKTNLNKRGSAFSKFRVPLLLTHPELIISTPFMSLTGFLEIDTFGHLSIPIAAPKPFYAK